MRRLRGRLTAAGVLVLLVLGFLGWTVWLRWIDADVTATVANMSGTAQIVRITDATSGRVLGTMRLESGTQAVVARHRLDVWWRDQTIPEKAAGAAQGLRIEVLEAGCGRLATEVLGRWDDAVLTISADDGLSRWAPDPAARVVPAPAAVADPCEGRPAPPVAVVQNPGRTPAVLNGRILVAACSTRIVRPGDATALLPAADTAGVEAFDVPSLAIQKGHWPAEPRGVVLGAEVEDDASDAIVNPRMLSACTAARGTVAEP